MFSSIIITILRFVLWLMKAVKYNTMHMINCVWSSVYYPAFSRKAEKVQDKSWLVTASLDFRILGRRTTA